MKYYVTFFFLIALSACSSTKEHTNYKYGKKPQHLQQPTLLRTDGVYLYVFNYEGKNDGYRFLRFFENGRCFVSRWFDKMPLNDTLTTTRKIDGQRTYFRNEGNKVKYEEWGGAYVRYIYVVCTSDSTGLNEESYKSRSFISTIHKNPKIDRFRFIPINFKNKFADW
ncbi:MAG: hypothetical protein J0I41_23565 [Filimonas sp.]|nr:hypothetical protein [Filimonas sp.]